MFKYKPKVSLTKLYTFYFKALHVYLSSRTYFLRKNILVTGYIMIRYRLAQENDYDYTKQCMNFIKRISRVNK